MYCTLCGQQHDTAACPPFPANMVRPTSGSDTILADMDRRLHQLGAEIDRLKSVLDDASFPRRQNK